MRNKTSWIILAVLMTPFPCHAKDVAGIDVPDSLETGETKLILNGAGVREQFFVRVYVGALYLEQKCEDSQEIIEANEPMAIRLHVIASNLTSEIMEKATREGFEKATDGNTPPIEAGIDRFITVFDETINKHDVFDLIYLPGKGTEVYKNKTYHSLTTGMPFKKALFGIWLCDKPAQRTLKRKMLGKPPIVKAVRPR